ncbi:hypothetical protein D9M68_813810 [compost metagenome]
MHLDQHRHVQPLRQRFQIGHLRVVQAGGDQQDGVGPHGAGLVDLVRVHHEVLAQHREVTAGTSLFQIVGAALKKLLVGQHRQAGGADLAIAFGVALGDVGRDEVFAQHALARAGLLDLGDHRGLAGGNLGPQGALEVACEQAAFGVEAHHVQRFLLARGGGGFVLDGHDLVQDVTHGFCFPGVEATGAPS